MDKLIGKEFGPYQVVSRLDKGSVATVYEAYQPVMDRRVALKILARNYHGDQTHLDRFLQEAQIVARLEHPYIVPVYDFGRVDNYLYIAMRLMKGGTLGDRFHGQPFSLEEIRQIVSHIGGALDYAHSEGVVHRDIKPKNILLDRLNNAMLTDFGIAKDLDSDAKITRLGRTVGTPSYMSPEQIQSDPLDGRSDIYALGVVLYQLATGYLPFQGVSLEEICNQHLHDPVPSARAINPDVPESLEQIITKMLAKKPEDRYFTARDVVRALDDLNLEKTAPVPNKLAKGEEATQPSPMVKVSGKKPQNVKATLLSPMPRTTQKTPPALTDSELNLSVPPPSDDDTAEIGQDSDDTQPTARKEIEAVMKKDATPTLLAPLPAGEDSAGPDLEKTQPNSREELKKVIKDATAAARVPSPISDDTAKAGPATEKTQPSPQVEPNKARKDAGPASPPKESKTSSGSRQFSVSHIILATVTALLVIGVLVIVGTGLVYLSSILFG